MTGFNDSWRRRKCDAFDLERNSTAKRLVSFDLWDRPVRVYANANLSIYSAQRCNGFCPIFARLDNWRSRQRVPADVVGSHHEEEIGPSSCVFDNHTLFSYGRLN
jgi:hypothetical protein